MLDFLENLDFDGSFVVDVALFFVFRFDHFGYHPFGHCNWLSFFFYFFSFPPKKRISFPKSKRIKDLEEREGNRERASRVISQCVTQLFKKRICKSYDG